VRTFHYYDEVELLEPESRGENSYGYYGEKAVAALQQILFFRELGFSLEETREIITKPGFDVLQALESHQSLLQKKAERIQILRNTIDKTIGKIKGET